MSLREDLARRLYEAHWAPTVALVGRAAVPFENQPDANREAWCVAADECIRQMEWARRQGADSVEASIIEIELAKEHGTITLAPPDWKP